VSIESDDVQLGRNPQLVTLGEVLAAHPELVAGPLRAELRAKRPLLSAVVEEIFVEGAVITTVAVGSWMAGAAPEETRAIGLASMQRYASLAAKREVGLDEAVKRMLLWRDVFIRETRKLVRQHGYTLDVEAEADFMIRRSLDISMVHLCDAYEIERQRTYDELLERQAEIKAQAKLAEERLQELRLTQLELVQAQKMESVGQLAAGIAHEINTPMQYIGDNTSFLRTAVSRLLDIAEAARMSVAPGATDADRACLATRLEKSRLPLLHERVPKAVDDALAGVDNVSRIVTAMKRFSHPGTDGMAPVDVNQSLTTTITVCRHEWKYVADLETDLADDLPLIDGNLGPLNQVWLNMIVNASHAVADRPGEAKGLIEVRTAAVEGGAAAQVTITDNGTGIAPENLDRIFDHFYTTKEVGKGTGQGLAIAHRTIVGEHHGTVGVASAPGEGTTFTITLPVRQPDRPTS
jgi:signal transduction histidine kinase